MGELLADHVGVHQPGHVDDAVVHLPPLGPPRDVADQRLEDVVGVAGARRGRRRPRRRGSARCAATPAKSMAPGLARGRRGSTGSPWWECTPRSNRCSIARDRGFESGAERPAEPSARDGTQSRARLLDRRRHPQCQSGAMTQGAVAARVRNLTKTYGAGEARVVALDDVTIDLEAGRVHRGDGAERLRQVDADALPGRARHRRLRLGDDRRPGPDRAQGQGAHPAAARRDRLRVPVLQPGADADRARRTSCCRWRSPAAAPTRTGTTR